MPLPSLICAGVETTLNKLLTLDATSDQRIASLKGKTVGVEVTELNQPLFFNFNDQHIEVLGQYEGDISVLVALDLKTLIILKNDGDVSALIKSDKLVINGDIKTLQSFADLLTKLDIDWEEHLSSYVGDIAAFKVSQGFQTFKQSVVTQTQKNKKHANDYLIEEAKVILGKLEFIHFSDQVDELYQQTEQLSQKINQFIHRGNS